MLLLKKVKSNSDIESLHIPFAEQNIYLLAQDASAGAESVIAPPP